MLAEWKSIIHGTTAPDLTASGRALREPHQVVSRGTRKPRLKIGDLSRLGSRKEKEVPASGTSKVPRTWTPGAAQRRGRTRTGCGRTESGWGRRGRGRGRPRGRPSPPPGLRGRGLPGARGRPGRLGARRARSHVASSQPAPAAPAPAREDSRRSAFSDVGVMQEGKLLLFLPFAASSQKWTENGDLARSCTCDTFQKQRNVVE